MSYRFRDSTLGRSIIRNPDRVTTRDRAAGHWSNFFLHIYPVKMRREEVGFRYSWFLGVASVTLFASLVVSGIYLMFFYVPSPASAYGNIQTLQTQVAFGQYIRNVHRWSAHLMVLAVAAHMGRTFYRGAYKPPREFNWVIGVVLLVLTLLLSFTGYLLPWDQLAYWAVTVGTSMAGYVPVIGKSVSNMLLGGAQVGASTLLRFYVLHVALLPATVVVLLALHLWRWRKDSMLDVAKIEAPERVPQPTPDGEPVVIGGKRLLGVVPGEPAAGERKVPEEQKPVMVWPHLLIRHAVAALGVLFLVLLLALAFDAPLRSIANPNLTPNPEKAPWYFAGLQELLSHFHPTAAGVLVPLAIIIGAMALPYIDRNPARRPKYRKVAIATFTIFLVAWIVLTLIGFAFRGPDWSWVWPWHAWYGEL
ncbi:MAG: cytochrome bc complex cytochrome b subunit [Acidimicrobiia bacterium]